VRDVRHGEHLWQCWGGEGYSSGSTAELVYFTLGEVDYDNDLVRRALASSLQRDGVVDSLSDGFRIIEDCVALLGFVGLLPGEREYTVCDSEGETEYGDVVDEVINATWVEIFN
jgi:hypothetical protein